LQTVDLPFFVELGAAIEHIEKLDNAAPLFDVLFAVIPLSGHLQALAAGEHVRLSAAMHDLQALRTSIGQFQKNFFTDEEGKWKRPEPEERAEYDVAHIKALVGKLKVVLIAELRTSSSFSVTGSGIFDVGLLVNGAHRALDPEIISIVGGAVRNELDDAGKCLAFNLYTAAGFHSMRAIERVIKFYLRNFFDEKSILRLKNWGQYLEALEKVGESAILRPSDEAIALIRQIKDIYRNPVIHPDRVLNSHEAKTIFHGTIAAITRIASEIKQAEPEIPGLSAPYNALAFGLGSFLSPTGKVAPQNGNNDHPDNEQVA
jgi:hypothetical protein